MTTKHTSTHWLFSILISIIPMVFMITACTPSSAPLNQTTSTAEEVTPEATETEPPPPTPTPPPLAARINSQGILLEDFAGELLRYQAANPQESEQNPTDEQQQMVLEEMIDQQLLAQAAAEAGFSITEPQLQARLDELTAAIGGPDKLAEWKSRNGYSDASLNRLLSVSIAAAWQRDQLASSAPTIAEQVLARQIMVLNASTANQIYQQLQNGASFFTLANTYDPMTGGSLGWFPRGYLTQPEIEEIAFSLEAGQFSEIIQTSFGYHIILVVEKNDQRELSPDAYKIQQRELLKNWLQIQREDSQIEIFIP